MTLNISVTDGNAILGYELTITDADPDELLLVYRVDESGHYDTAVVRGLDYMDPSSSTVVVTDFEAPFNTTLTYHAEVYDRTDLDTPVATDTASIVRTDIPLGYSMLMDAVQPALRISGSVEKLPAWSRTGRIFDEKNVIGKSLPVITNDVLGGRKGNLHLINIHAFQLEYNGVGLPEPYEVYSSLSWRTILSSGRTLLFRNSWRETGFDDCYMKIKSVSYDRIGVLTESTPILTLELEYVEVDRPPTSVESLGLTSWQDLEDAGHADWNSVEATFTDWADLESDPGRTPV